jgi:hypothetical protein
MQIKSVAETEMTLTLPGGLKITGRQSQIMDLAKSMGTDLSSPPLWEDGTTYYSESKKKHMPIKDMEVTHARNSFVKRYLAGLERLKLASRTMSNEEFYEKWSNLTEEVIQDKTLLGLLLHIKTSKEAK